MTTPTNNPQQSQDRWIRFERIGLFLVIALAIIIRGAVNFSTDLMPGIISAYYPVQVRSLLENGELKFPDFPFVFYLEAGLAKPLQILGFCDLNDCVMFSSKIIDSTLYPLIAIPIFFLAKTITKTPRWTPLLSAMLVTISGPSFLMMADFQKNSIGLMWFAFYLYFLYKAMADGKLTNYFWAGVFFILTGLTHLGVLGVIIAFTLSFFFFSFLLQPQKRIKLLKILGLLIVAAGLVFLTLFFFSPERMKSLASTFLSPLMMFENPTIIGIFRGYIPIMPTLLDFLFPNLLVILGLVLFVIKRKEMLLLEKVLLLASLLLTAFMSSPLLKDELGNRLYKMTYILMAVIFIIALKYIYANWKNILFTSLVPIILIGSAPIFVIARSEKGITDESYQDLFKLKTVIDYPEKTLIITRHGLEYWTAWALKVDAIFEQGLTKEFIEKYKEVYYLKQKTGQGDFGPFGPGGPPFPEVEIPTKTQIVYEDEFFILAKTLPGFLGYPHGEKKSDQKYRQFKK